MSDHESGELPYQWTRDLSAGDYLEYCLEIHSQARSAAVFIEVFERMPDWDRVRAAVERTSRVALRMRQHVVTPVLPVAAARWVTDPDFDLDYHLRRVSLPGPGSMRQLLDLAQTVQASPLDLDRPLWEATFVEGLAPEGGAAALIWKLAQPVADGLSGVVIDRSMHSDVADPDLGPMPPIPVPEDLSPGDLTRDELRRLPVVLGRQVNRRAGDAVRLVAGGARDPIRAVRKLGNLAQSFTRVNPEPVAEPSPLLRRRSLNRRFETLDVDLAGLRHAARAQGCSVQDAYLAAVCGGLRRYHEHLGVPVVTLPLAMPIGISTGGEPAGNLWAGLRIAAPVGEAEPVARMRQVREAVLAAHADEPTASLTAAAPLVPWLPVQVFGAFAQAGRDIDVHVANAAGHAGDVFVAGQRLSRVIPFGPLLGGAMTLVACSMAGRHFVGVNLDPVAVAEPAAFLQCLADGFAEVIGADDATLVP